MKKGKKRDEELFLLDIAAEIERINKFTIHGRDSFLADEMAQYAVMKSIENIGEAIKHLSPEQKTQVPNYDWHGAAKTRDFFAHHYFSVSMKQLWNTVEKDIPVLSKIVSSMIEKINVSKKDDSEESSTLSL